MVKKLVFQRNTVGGACLQGGFQNPVDQFGVAHTVLHHHFRIHGNGRKAGDGVDLVEHKAVCGMEEVHTGEHTAVQSLEDFHKNENTFMRKFGGAIAWIVTTVIALFAIWHKQN